MDKRHPSIGFQLIDEEQANLTECSTLESKPLPKLPGGWPRVCHETALFLRGLGLGVVVSAYHGLFRKDFSEPTKVVLRQSRIAALLRMMIHVVPMGVALMEIVLNMKGHYLGSEFSKQSFVQFAAKAHELTMQASLAAIVLSYIRYEVSFGKGIPFGAFLGSLQFSQISYLWSLEFWSSLLAPDFRLARKFCLLLVVVPCAIIAAVAGPSSANLLIPRQGIWLMNPSSRLAVNATFSDIWPDQLDGSHVPGNCAALQMTSADAPCPSYDWASIQSALEYFNTSALADFEDSSHDHEDYLSVTNDGAAFSKITQSLLCTSSAADQFCASSPQEAILYGLDDAFRTWFNSIADTISFNDVYATIHSNYYEPYGIVSCFADHIDDANKHDLVQFPRLSETKQELAKPRVISSLPSLSKEQLLDSPRNISEYQLTWTKLPNPLFNDKAFGAVIMYPQETQAASGLQQNVMACTLKAGWGTSSVRTDGLDEGQYYSTIVGIPSSWPTYTFNSGEVEDESDPNFTNYSGFQYPQRLIDISPDWAAFLNPLIPTNDGTNTSLINTYLDSLREPYNEVGIAKLLGILLTSGLGRQGVGSNWQVTSSSTPQCEECLEFDIVHSLLGWSYNLQSTASKLAVTVMIIYCVLAFLHIVYSGVSGISSTAWDSSAEVVALAMNSTPTANLQNTCGGIIGVKTFKTPVRVLAKKVPGQVEEHLELAFSQSYEREAGWEKVSLNREYG